MSTDTDRTDVTSLMTQVATLASANKMLEDKLKENSAIVDRFKEQERAEMKKKFDTVIQQWIEENDWSEPGLKESVLNGAKDMMMKNKKDSTLWNMICCASATHSRNVNELQKVQEMYNELKGKVESGTFKGEEARTMPSGSKRKEPEMSGPIPSSESGGCIWDQFESSFRAGGDAFIPDPEVLRNLRSELRQE